MSALVEKTLSTEVAENVIVRIQIVNRETVRYQFIGLDDKTADPIFETNFVKEFDDFNGRYDLCFYTQLGSKFFLSQFEKDYVA